MSAAALTTVFAAHVFTGFHPIRVRVIQSGMTAADGRVHAEAASAELQQLRAPFAVIWRIRHDMPTAVRLTVSIDGQAVCSRSVPPARAIRLDCAMTEGWSPAGVHRLTIDGPPAPWHVEYVELATHHGGSEGSRHLVVVPAGSAQFTRPAPAAVALVWLVLTAVLLVPAAPSGVRLIVMAHRSFAALIVAALAAILLLPWVTPYHVIVSTGAFARWTCVLLLWPLLAIGERLAGPASDPQGAREGAAARAGRRRSIVLSLGIAGLAILVYGQVVSNRLADYHGNYSGFLGIAAERFRANPLMQGRDDVRRQLVLAGNNGYDGQFMYYVAFDPFLRALRPDIAGYRAVADAPPYRFGRIGFPLLAKLVSLDRWPAYPAVMLWLVLLSLGAVAFLLALLAWRHGASPAWGLLVLLVPGFWQSLQFALPEPVSAALLVAGVLLLESDRRIAAGLVLALALLVRETGMVLVLCLIAADVLAGRRRDAFVLAVLALAPFACWRLYVGATFQSSFGWEAYFFSGHNAALPFGGFVRLWHQVAAGAYHGGDGGLSRAAVTYPIVLAAGLALALAALIRRPGALTAAAAAYGILAVSLSFPSVWGYVPDGERVTFELFMSLALVFLIAPPRGWQRRSPLMFWILAAGYVFWGGSDSLVFRGDVLALVW